MKTRQDLFKDSQNLINSANPPKSIFTIEEKFLTSFTADEHLALPSHYHDWYELYYMREGECIYHMNRRNYYVNSGSWILITPHTKHKTFYQSSDCRRYLIYFSRDYIHPTLFNHLNHLTDCPVFSPAASEQVLLDSLADKLMYNFKNPNEFSTELSKNYLFEIFVTFITKISQASPGQAIDSDLLVEYTTAYIDKHYAEDLSLPTLADINYITPNYLSRIFKQKTGTNITQYIQFVRLKNAKLLLNETDDSISSIAYQCGFNDSNYFSYVFKQSEHMSPMQYRKANR